MNPPSRPGKLEREPKWLVAAVDQRVAQFKDVVMSRRPDLVSEVGFVVFMLREAGESISDYQLDRWNTTCDNCLTYFKPGHPDYSTIYVTREVDGLQLSIVGGACTRCLELP